MKIEIDKLTDDPAPIRLEASPDWWREQCGEGAAEWADAVPEPIRVQAQGHRMGESVYLEGAVIGSLELTCSRCLTRYRAPIRERFRLVLEPGGARVPADPEGALAYAQDGLYLTDELESGWFRGSEIGLDRFVREVVALVLPVKPLCREDCRGLCPRCGIDRNQECCDCEELKAPSPFAVLEALRDRVR